MVQRYEFPVRYEKSEMRNLLKKVQKVAITGKVVATKLWLRLSLCKKKCSVADYRG